MSEGRTSLPAAPPQTPGMPSNPESLVFEGFSGLNTKPPRPAIRDDECAWLDGFMPLGPSHLAILPGIGVPIYTAPTSDIAVVWFGFGNIGDTEYCYVLQSDGALVAYDFSTLGLLSILPPGSILAPSTIVGFSQWGSLYALFTKDQTDGYWLWDGVNTFTSGTLSPFVDINSGGLNYTSLPTVTVLTTGTGAGATFLPVLDGDAVSRINVTNPGSGFAKDDFVLLSFSGGGSDDMATATANLSPGGGVTGVVVTAPGSGYTFATSLSFSGGGGSGAAAVANIQNGAIISVTIINPGQGYTSPPSILATDPGYGSGPSHIVGGSGAAGYVTIGSNGISSVAVDSGGSGYTSVPTAEVIGDGTGAQLVPHIAGGVVTDIAVTNPGQGYTKALVKISGGNNAANADVIVMPFGISGTTLEIYQGRVWNANGGAVAAFPPKNRALYTAPESPVDFGHGGGAFVGTDSFLRVGWHSLKQSNGFLYLIGDSSLNYISGVNTSEVGTPPVISTTFNNQNSDPQIGSPWPSSVQLFNRNIVFANVQGVYVSYGGAVTKVSAPLDGFYSNGPIFGAFADYSSAVAQIFGIQVYMLLLPIVDPLSGATENRLLMWDGKKWWTSAQDRSLSFVATREINSNLSAWGTDGRQIFPLFVSPSSSFPKKIQSKLWANPGYDYTKTATRLYAIFQDLSTDATFDVSIDNETSPSPITGVTGGAGTDIFGPAPVGQQGRLIGITGTTTCSSGRLLSIRVLEQQFMLNN